MNTLDTGPLPPEPLGLAAAYRALKNKRVADEPHIGYHRADQMGPLTNIDLAAIVNADPDIVSDAVSSDAFLEALRGKLLITETGSIECAALLGAILLGCLHATAKRHLYTVVTDEIAESEDNARNDAADEVPARFRRRKWAMGR